MIKHYAGKVKYQVIALNLHALYIDLCNHLYLFGNFDFT